MSFLLRMGSKEERRAIDTVSEYLYIPSVDLMQRPSVRLHCQGPSCLIRSSLKVTGAFAWPRAGSITRGQDLFFSRRSSLSELLPAFDICGHHHI